MRTADFELLRDLLKERSGLALTEDKVYLLESRLNPVARKFGMERLEDLVEQLRTARNEKLVSATTEAMTTNESFFYRDGQPFITFEKEVLPRIIDSNKHSKSLRIWCAACSTGQEPYSLAMILKENQAKLLGWRIEILGTDLSAEVLEKARVGIYSQFEVQRGLPIQMLMKYFKETNDMWQLDSSIRAMATFREFNLLSPFTSFGRFDVIFCRNVLIYFDQPTKADVLHRVSQILAPDGCLFLGAAETVLGVSEVLKPVPGMRGIYAVAA